jgi:hypothetical protein
MEQSIPECPRPIGPMQVPFEDVLFQVSHCTEAKQCHYTTIHAPMTVSQPASYRVSVGIEHLEDIKADFAQALRKATAEDA